MEDQPDRQPGKRLGFHVPGPFFHACVNRGALCGWIREMSGAGDNDWSAQGGGTGDGSDVVMLYVVMLSFEHPAATMSHVGQFCLPFNRGLSDEFTQTFC